MKLPVLSGKPKEKAMKISLKCISLCDPDGVNAFPLVLTLDAPSDEDKKEIEAIRNTFSSRVNDFTTILFNTKANSNLSVVLRFLKESRDIKQLVCFQHHGQAASL